MFHMGAILPLIAALLVPAATFITMAHFEADEALRADRARSA